MGEEAPAPELTRWKAVALAAALGAAAPAVFESGLLIRDLAGTAVARAWVPLLAAALFWPPWVRLVARGRLSLALGSALVWALASSVVSIAAVAATGDRYEPVLLRGAEYRDSMLAWIRTGVGEESDPSLFLPEHAKHFAIFSALALVSCGFLALALGAALLHYMNFYVGCLPHAAHAADGATALDVLAIGWPPYAVVRVAGYVATAVALAAFALWRFRGAAIEPRRIRRMLWLGLALVVADAALKAVIAPAWGELLRDSMFAH